MTLDCGCVENDEGQKVVFCRGCSISLEQGGEEWRRARLGKLTASRASDAFARIKTGWGASRANYRAELICERLSGVPYDGYTNGYMDRGNKVEPQAVLAYEFIVGLEAQATGFWPHPTIGMAGASPDRLVGDDGQIEAKCRTSAIHFELLLTNKIPQKFIDQMQFSLACTGRKWSDFVSYDDRVPGEYDLYVYREYRNEARISELERMGVEFLAEVDEKARALQEKAAGGFIFTKHESPYGHEDNSLMAQLNGSLVSYLGSVL